MTTVETKTFIETFLTWRKNHLTTNYKTESTVDVSTLTPEKFMALTTYQKGTDTTLPETDFVKTEADSYMYDLIKANLTDNGRSVLNVSKPTLSTEITGAIVGEGYAAEITKYSNLWLLQFLKERTENSKSYSRVKSKATTDFQASQGSKIMTDVNMKFSYLATVKKVPAFIPYMYNADTLKDKVKSYLLEDVYKETWVEKAFNSNKVLLNEADVADHSYAFSELKAKLDILDPSFGLSSTVLSEYYSHLYAIAAPFSLKNTPKIKRMFRKITTDVLVAIAKSTSHPWTNLVTDWEAIYTSKGTFGKILGDALFHMSKLMVNAAKTKAVSASDAYVINKDKFIEKLKKIKGAIPVGKPELVAKWEESTTFKLVSGLFVLVNAGVIYKGLYSYDKLTDPEKVSLWITSAQTGVDGITSIVDAIQFGYKAYKWIGAKIADLIKPNVVSPIAQAVATKNVAKFATLIKMTKYLKIVTGVLLVASMLVSGYELVTAIANKQWGEAALSLTELSLTFALFVLTFFVSTSWSGPACLVLTFVLIVIAVAKIFWDTITHFFTGDPVENYYKDNPTYIMTSREYLDYMYAALDAYNVKHPENAIVTRNLRLTLDKGNAISMLPE